MTMRHKTARPQTAKKTKAQAKAAKQAKADRYKFALHQAKLGRRKMKLIALRGEAAITFDAAEDGKDPVAKFNCAPVYSGAPVPGYTSSPALDFDYVVDLAGMKPGRNMVCNLDHNSRQRVGHVVDFDNDKKQINCAGLLSCETEYRDEVVGSSKNGYKWEVSMEGEMSGLVFIERDKKVTVNGRALVGPLYVFRNSTFGGLAFCSQGADEGNRTKIAASAEGATMNEFEKFCMSLGVTDIEAITDEHRANLEKQFKLMQGGGGSHVSRKSFKEKADEAREEQKRVDRIHDVALQYIEKNRHLTDQIEQAAEDAVEQHKTPRDFEFDLMKETSLRSGTINNTRRPADNRVYEAALAMNAGLPNLEKHYKPEILEAVDRAGLRQFGLQQMLIMTAHQNGYVCRPGEKVTQGNLKTILQYCFPPDMHRTQLSLSTISLPGILGAVANKESLEGFSEEGQEWKEVGVTKPVNNFHAVTSYRMNDNLEYEEVGPGGEIPHGSLSEESYTRQAKTYAKQLGLTRNDIINDDLGAFDDIRVRLGRGASRKFNIVFWTKWLDNASFFTSGRGNYISGSTTNLGVDGVGLSAAVLAFRKLRSADGKRISGQPVLLVVPPELETIARGHWTSKNVNTGGSSTATSVPNDNVFQGLYRPVVVDFLSDTSITGYSTTAFYLVRDPRLLAGLVVSFLNGQQFPTIESTDADFGMLGIRFRGVHDFGVDPAEYLCGVKSKGAA